LNAAFGLGVLHLSKMVVAGFGFLDCVWNLEVVDDGNANGRGLSGSCLILLAATITVRGSYRHLKLQFVHVNKFASFILFLN
jgi:hypothetical protein